jgi:hypothetical protein
MLPSPSQRLVGEHYYIAFGNILKPPPNPPYPSILYFDTSHVRQLNLLITFVNIYQH